MKIVLEVAVLWLVLMWLLAVVSEPAESWNQLLGEADSLSDAANYDSAIVLGNMALKQVETQFGKSDTRVALVLDQMGAYHYYRADYDEAESLWKQALAIREKAFSSEHPDVAKALHNLASLYDDQSK
jgi:tetratricopeptide (TPR) repeat protein